MRELITSLARDADPSSEVLLISAANSDLPVKIVDDLRSYLGKYHVELPEVEIVKAYSPKIQFITWDDWSLPGLSAQ